jgi:pilus assembly protein Flp/PilA
MNISQLLRHRLTRLGRGERGATAVEYGLLIAGIAGLVVLVIFAFGAEITSLYQDTCTDVSTRSGNGTC